jgi:hypothetical protein
MTFEQFATIVRDWASRLTPREFRAEVARQLASADGVEGLDRNISIDAALVMVSMGLGPGMRPVVMRGSAPRGAETELVLGSEPPRESGKAKLPSGGRSLSYQGKINLRIGV